MTGGLVFSEIDFLRRLKKDEGFLPSVGGCDSGCVSVCEDDVAVWGAFANVLVWTGAWLPVFGVVRGRFAEYIEVTSAACGLLGAGVGSVCDAFDRGGGFCCCDWGFAEPPPKTRRKKPGLEAAGGCGGNNGTLAATLDDGADESCQAGTGGSSRNLLALTNSSACARMLGPG